MNWCKIGWHTWHIVRSNWRQDDNYIITKMCPNGYWTHQEYEFVANQLGVPIKTLFENIPYKVDKICKKCEKVSFGFSKWIQRVKEDIKEKNKLDGISEFIRKEVFNDN